LYKYGLSCQIHNVVPLYLVGQHRLILYNVAFATKCLPATLVVHEAFHIVASKDGLKPLLLTAKNFNQSFNNSIKCPLNFLAQALAKPALARLNTQEQHLNLNFPLDHFNE